jgi:uncharacterized protein (TIGR02646 family)
MRHVPTGQAPASLQVYVTTLGATNPATNAAQAKALWNAFRGDPAYKDCLDALRTAQSGVCGYCEQRAITTPIGTRVEQIEHVEPKSVQNARTLDFSNFLLCCSGGSTQTPTDPGHHYVHGNESCGQSKGNALLPAAMDPRRWPPHFRLTDTTVDGRLQVREEACTRLGISTADAGNVINSTLNLNCDRLRRAREKTVQRVQELIRRHYFALQANLDNPSMRRALKTKLKELRAEILKVDHDGYLPSFVSVIEEYLSV